MAVRKETSLKIRNYTFQAYDGEDIFQVKCTKNTYAEYSKHQNLILKIVQLLKCEGLG